MQIDAAVQADDEASRTKRPVDTSPVAAVQADQKKTKFVAKGQMKSAEKKVGNEAEEGQSHHLAAPQQPQQQRLGEYSLPQQGFTKKAAAVVKRASKAAAKEVEEEEEEEESLFKADGGG